MERTERTKFIHGYSQLAVRPVEEDGGAPKVGDKVGDFTVVGDGKVSIPQRKVPEDVLETRSVAAAVPQQPRVPIPESWLEFTVENTAHLTEDEIVQRLLFQGRFDPSKFGIMLSLPDGDLIVPQLINGMSGNCLLKSIGGNIRSADDFTYILFEKKYFAKKKETNEIPTTKVLASCIVQVEFSPYPLPEGLPLPGGLLLPGGIFNEQIIALSQEVIDTYTNEDKRKEFERRARNIVDLIFSKLPLPNEENRVYWNNIYEAVRTMKANPNRGEEKLAEVKKRFPVFEELSKLEGNGVFQEMIVNAR